MAGKKTGTKNGAKRTGTKRIRNTLKNWKLQKKLEIRASSAISF